MLLKNTINSISLIVIAHRLIISLIEIISLFKSLQCFQIGFTVFFFLNCGDQNTITYEKGFEK